VRKGKQSNDNANRPVQKKERTYSPGAAIKKGKPIAAREGGESLIRL